MTSKTYCSSSKVSDKAILKSLNEGFEKFENCVKNYGRNKSLDLSLPIRIIELFSRLFKIWSDVPELSHVIDAHQFLDVYFQLKEFFDDDQFESYSDSSADFGDDKCENCFNVDLSAYHQLLQGVYGNKKLSFANSSDSAKKSKTQEVMPGVEWLLEKNGLVLCDVCNMKFSDSFSLLEHMTGVQHLKNYNTLKSNDHYVTLPDVKNECFQCKACKIEYSNLNSLVKHFFKLQHIQCVKNAEEMKSADDQAKNKKITNIENIKINAGTDGTPKYNQKFIAPSKKVGKFCQVCEKELPTISDVLSHVKDVEHARKISIFESNQHYAQLSKNGDKLHCLLCGVLFRNVSKLAGHFEEDHHQQLVSLNAGSSTSAIPDLRQKLEDKGLINSVQLRDSDKRFVIAEKEIVKCVLCRVKLSTVSEIITHVNGKSHSHNVNEFTNYQEYFKLPSGVENSFSCVKCPKKFDDFTTALSHHKESHMIGNVSLAKLSSSEPWLNERDEKFIKKIGKSNRCVLCDKELPTQATIVSHCGSVNHIKNADVLLKNEKHTKLPQKNGATFRCCLCDIDFEHLTLLIKHFKRETHKKSTEVTEKKAPNNQNSVHIPSYTVIKADKISKLIGESKSVNSANSTTTKKTRRISESNVNCNKNKGRTQTVLQRRKKCPAVPVSGHFTSNMGSTTGDKVPETTNNAAFGKNKRKEKTEIAIEKNVTSVFVNGRASNAESFASNNKNVAKPDNDHLYKPFPIKKPDDSYVIAKKDIFYCRLCDVDLPAVTVAAHMNGATHRINVEVLEACRSFVRNVNQLPLECVLCDATFENVHELVKHLKVERHSKPDDATAQKEDGEKMNDGIFGPSYSLIKQTTFEPNAEVLENMPPSGEKRVKIDKRDRRHIFRLNGVFRCNLCGIKLADVDALETHVSNLNHKRNSNVYQDNESFIIQLDSVGDNFECTLCAFSSPLDKVIKHCKKKRHSKAKDGDENEPSIDNTASLQNDSEVVLVDEFDHRCIVMTNGVVRCNLCRSKLPRESTLISHMNGSSHKHFRQIYKANKSLIEHSDDVGGNYRCKLCDAIFTRLDTAMKHCSEDGHVQLKSKHFDTGNDTSTTITRNDDVLFNVTICDFECTLCSITFYGFANLAKHCFSKQHKILKNAIQPIQGTLPYNVTVNDYQYHCNACDVRLHNKSEMQKHQNTKTHVDSERYFKCETRQTGTPPVIELVGYEYLCNFCSLPMYSEAELAIHEKSEMHKTSKNFDDVWRLNEVYMQLNNSSDKVVCKLCDKTFGIERLIQHCTSRSHRMKFVAEQIEEYTEDEHIVYKNTTPYCDLCDCKLINDHNFINHVNSEGHKLKITKKK